jgi:branched-chain amino acid transport system substrate-binding protein
VSEFTKFAGRGASSTSHKAFRRVALGVASVLPPLVLGTGVIQAQASPAPITIAYISSLTGVGASEDSTSVVGFEARLDLQNAQGGVDGHKLVPLILDDQTNPSSIATDVQEADSKAFGIVSQSPLFFLADKYPQAAGGPVTGSYDDGPEWGQQPYTNMFAADVGSVDPNYPVNTQAGAFLKKEGGTNLATFGYSISPSSSRAAIQTADSFLRAGGKVGLLNTTVAFGGVDFSAAALTAAQDHINALSPEMDDNSNFALAEALQQAGVKLKASYFATGYEPSVIHSAAWPALQGDYFASVFRPWALPNAATRSMQSAMEKYAHFSATQFPTFSQYEAWAGADLMIKGLELAGKNATRAGVIHALRGLKSYNAGGLLPHSFNYSTNFGHDPAQQCTWMMKATETGFKPVQAQPFCGTDIPGTATLHSTTDNEG